MVAKQLFPLVFVRIFYFYRAEHGCEAAFSSHVRAHNKGLPQITQLGLGPTEPFCNSPPLIHYSSNTGYQIPMGYTADSDSPKII